MWRNGASAATADSAASSAFSAGRAKPRSSRAPGASTSSSSPSMKRSVCMSLLRGIVEDDPESVAPPVAQPADAVAERDAVVAARAPMRPAVDREHDGVALAERNHLGARLHARPLLGEHELAAVEILSRRRQQDRELQRKDVVAIEILVQAIVVAGAVLQQERGGPRLARGVA